MNAQVSPRDGESIAILIIETDGDGGYLMFGTLFLESDELRFKGNKASFLLPDGGKERLRLRRPDDPEYLRDVKWFTTLYLGPLPDDVDPSSYEEIGVNVNDFK